MNAQDFTLSQIISSQRGQKRAEPVGVITSVEVEHDNNPSVFCPQSCSYRTRPTSSTACPRRQILTSCYACAAKARRNRSDQRPVWVGSQGEGSVCNWSQSDVPGKRTLTHKDASCSTVGCFAPKRDENRKLRRLWKSTLVMELKAPSSNYFLLGTHSWRVWTAVFSQRSDVNTWFSLTAKFSQQRAGTHPASSGMWQDIYKAKHKGKVFVFPKMNESLKKGISSQTNDGLKRLPLLSVPRLEAIWKEGLLQGTSGRDRDRMEGGNSCVSLMTAAATL